MKNIKQINKINTNMDTKNLIIQETMKLLIDSGFVDIPLSKIVEKTKLSSGTIYYYFNSKDEIIIAALDKYIQQMMEHRIDKVKKYNGDTYQKLEYLFRQLLGYDPKHEVYWIPIDVEIKFTQYKKVILLASQGIQKYPELNKKYNQFNNTYKQYVEEYITEGQKNKKIRTDLTIKELSYFIQSNINGIFYMILIQNNLNVEELIQYEIKNVWNYIKNKE